MRRACAVGYVFLMIVTSGCGGEGDAILDRFGFVESTGRGAIEGLLDGQEFDVHSTLSTRFGPNEGSRSAAILMSNVPDLCSLTEEGRELGDSRYLLIQAWDYESSQSQVPTDPGLYPVFLNPNTQPKQAFVHFLWSEPDCDYWLSDATGGSLELEAIDGDVFDGTVSFTTEDDEDAVATFEPVPCEAVKTFIFDPLTCE